MKSEHAVAAYLLLEEEHGELLSLAQEIPAYKEDIEKSQRALDRAALSVVKCCRPGGFLSIGSTPVSSGVFALSFPNATAYIANEENFLKSLFDSKHSRASCTSEFEFNGKKSVASLVLGTEHGRKLYEQSAICRQGILNIELSELAKFSEIFFEPKPTKEGRKFKESMQWLINQPELLKRLLKATSLKIKRLANHPEDLKLILQSKVLQKNMQYNNEPGFPDVVPSLQFLYGIVEDGGAAEQFKKYRYMCLLAAKSVGTGVLTTESTQKSLFNSLVRSNHPELVPYLHETLDAVFDRLTPVVKQEHAQHYSNATKKLSQLTFAKFHYARGGMWECSQRQAKYCMMMIHKKLEEVGQSIDLFADEYKQLLLDIFTKLGENEEFNFKGKQIDEAFAPLVSAAAKAKEQNATCSI